MGNLLQELKRRKVFRVTAVYAVVAWVLIQIVDVVLPTFNAPLWVNQTLILLLMLGLPVAVVLAWAFEITPEGILKTEASKPGEASNLRKRDYLVGAALSGLIALVVVQQFVILNRPVLDESIASEENATESLSPVEELVGDTAGIPNSVIEKSVAVLPFVSMSSGVEDGYFADGLTEELLNVLAQISDLKVPGRTSSFYYKGRDQDLREIGQALGVAYLLEGSVRRSGDQIRITAQLVNAADGFHLWSATFDRTLDDIFAIQDEIAYEVTQALRIELLGEEAEAIRSHGTDNAEAQQFYMIGIAQMRELGFLTRGMQQNPAPWGRVRGLFERAVELDPEYAEGWAALVEILLTLSGPGLVDSGNILLTRQQGRELSQSALANAEALAPELPSVLLARAQYNERLIGLSPELIAPVSPTTATSVGADYERALATDPDNMEILDAYADFQLQQNLDPASSIALLNRIIELDPLSPRILLRANLIAYFDPEEARRQFGLMADLYPDSNWRLGLGRLEVDLGHLHHAYLYMQSGGLEMLEFIPFSLGYDNATRDLRSDPISRGGSLGITYQLSRLMYTGDFEAALEVAEANAEGNTLNVASIAKLESLNRLRRFEEAAQFVRSVEYFPSFREDLFESEPMSFPVTSSIDALEVAYALQQTGEVDLADEIRSRIREHAVSLSPQATGIWLAPKLAHELNFLLYASEGRVEKAITEFEGMVAEGWRFIYGPSSYLMNAFVTSSTIYRFEDSPLLDSVRDHPRFGELLDFVEADLAAQRAEIDNGLTIDSIEH